MRVEVEACCHDSFHLLTSTEVLLQQVAIVCAADLLVQDDRHRLYIPQQHIMMPSKADIVTISYDALVAACNNADYDTVDNLIEKAFGSSSSTTSSSSSLGIIAITNVPNLTELRTKLLPLAYQLATQLTSSQLDEITAPQSQYQVGWSHGREKLEGDKLDYSKGSYYANPLTDDLVESMLERRRYLAAAAHCDDDEEDEDESDARMKDLIKWDESIDKIKNEDELRQLAHSNPAFFAPNVWPTASLPEMEMAFKEVGRLIHTVGVMVAKCCDSYVAARVSVFLYVSFAYCELFSSHMSSCSYLHVSALDTILVLLRTFYCIPSVVRLDCFIILQPMIREIAAIVTLTTIMAVTTVVLTIPTLVIGVDGIMSSLTGLLPAMYHDEHGNPVPCPDENAGLYIKSRHGELIGPVKLPENALAFQVGETMQVHTGGWLQATPHAVRGCNKNGISRSTFAVFMEPEYHSSMNLPPGRTVDDTQCVEAERSLPKSVRTLRLRWKLGMNFGEFSAATFAAFH